MGSLRILAVFAIAAAAVMTVVSTVQSASHNNGAKPGWGYGDKNHVHSGPPGLTVVPSE